MCTAENATTVNYWCLMPTRAYLDGGFLTLTKLQQLAYLKLMFLYFDGNLNKNVSANSLFDCNKHLAKNLDCSLTFILSLKKALLRENLIDENWTPLLATQVKKED